MLEPSHKQQFSWKYLRLRKRSLYLWLHFFSIIICTMTYNRGVHLLIFCQIIDLKSRKTFCMILSHDQSERKNTWLSTIYIKMVTKTTNHWLLLLIKYVWEYDYFDIFSFATFLFNMNVSLKIKWVSRMWTWLSPQFNFS